ncbi:MAG: hypothetical protein QM791_17280 [Ferruginibacter sp.]
MIAEKSFIRFAAICAFMSAITTLIVHLYFTAPESFDERILLFKNKQYLFRNWAVVFHCVFVIVSMYAVFLLRKNESPGWMGTGFIFFCVFAITEIVRMFTALFYTNQLRQKYYTTADETVRSLIRNSFDNIAFLNDVLFSIFIMAFWLGLAAYGTGLFKSSGFTRVLAVVFVIWAGFHSLAIINIFYPKEWIGKFMEIFSPVYQPLARVVIGVWLWKNINSLNFNHAIKSNYS